jgi:4-hydroxy-3-methylbut-2-en-1-yl diphosphate reductase
MSPRIRGGGRARSREESPDLLILAPLALEAAALGRSRPSVRVLRTGMGPLRAAHAAERAAAVPSRAVAVAGLCGALDPALRPGELVVATEIIGPNRRVPCGATGPLVAALRAVGVEATLGPIASADHVISGSERQELRRAGAVAVDMESSWLVGAAGDRPLAVVRAVVDTPGRELGRPLATMLGGLAALRTMRRSVPALQGWARAASPRDVLLAAPRSFCAGVDRAVEIVERALDRYGPPVYVRKQIVHNVHVVRDLERRGAIFVESVDEVPEGKLVVFSAHGVSPAVREEADRRNLRVIDATCPLVTKVHLEARRFAGRGNTIVLIGHAGHEEVVGTTGQAPERTILVQSPAEARTVEIADAEHLSYLTQTTLSVDETNEIVAILRERFPTIEGPPREDICYATQNRQDAVKEIARRSDVVLVIGSRNSSNSNRLAEVAREQGTPAYLVDDETELDRAWLTGADVVGLTSGASAPERLVERMLDALRSMGATEVEEVSLAEESLRFSDVRL